MEEFFAKSNMLSSAAEDREANINDPDEYVAANEYDFDPEEIANMNREYQNKEDALEKSPETKGTLYSGNQYSNNMR